MRFYAYHGVMEQERRVGGWFLVSLRVGCDLALAARTDRVDDTVSYAALYALVKREMLKPSNLLEHVAGRMVDAIANDCPQVTAIDLWLTKENPPMGADCRGAGVEMHWKRQDGALCKNENV